MRTQVTRVCREEERTPPPGIDGVDLRPTINQQLQWEDILARSRNLRLVSHLSDGQLAVPGGVLQRRRAVVQPPIDVGAALPRRPQQLRHVLDVAVGAGVHQLLRQPQVEAVLLHVLAGVAAVLVLVPGPFSSGSGVEGFLLKSELTCSWPGKRSPRKCSC